MRAWNGGVSSVYVYTHFGNVDKTVTVSIWCAESDWALGFAGSFTRDIPSDCLWSGMRKMDLQHKDEQHLWINRLAFKLGISVQRLSDKVTFVCGRCTGLELADGFCCLGDRCSECAVSRLRMGSSFLNSFHPLLAAKGLSQSEGQHVVWCWSETTGYGFATSVCTTDEALCWKLGITRGDCIGLDVWHVGVKTAVYRSGRDLFHRGNNSQSRCLAIWGPREDPSTKLSARRVVSYPHVIHSFIPILPQEIKFLF